ncbi:MULTISPECIES: hypothetical protein [Trichocoleus]|uniref:Uncharacterized protein n=1 Tax=Trichocoleus desertorum GB2-A4 TaxID=2933944 RepID=A0ABV0JCL0_9CYAN|nr:hypothetical protein [Trichocoleus sp. FACHB-46]MBD1864171.1 hypothetical protein [Trichocoleus sp. FACHB-46]
MRILALPARSEDQGSGDEAEPNVSQETKLSKQDEFDNWYLEVVRARFCLDIPERHLGTVGNELVVKIISSRSLSDYEAIP